MHRVGDPWRLGHAAILGSLVLRAADIAAACAAYEATIRDLGGVPGRALEPDIPFSLAHDRVEPPALPAVSNLDDPTLASIASGHDATTAQIVIAWHVAHGFVVITKPVHQERIAANAAGRQH